MKFLRLKTLSPAAITTATTTTTTTTTIATAQKSPGVWDHQIKLASCSIEITVFKTQQFGEEEHIFPFLFWISFSDHEITRHVFSKPSYFAIFRLILHGLVGELTVKSPKQEN